MEVIAGLWGLSLNQTVLLVAAILVVVDFFIPSDVPTHIAYVILCVLVAINIDAHILVKILCALLAWFALVAFHYTIWRVMIRKMANHFIAPDRYRSGVDGVVGGKGTIRIVDGRRMVRVQGDLWPCRGADGLADGTHVEIVSQTDGELEVMEERSR